MVQQVEEKKIVIYPDINLPGRSCSANLALLTLNRNRNQFQILAGELTI